MIINNYNKVGISPFGSGTDSETRTIYITLPHNFGDTSEISIFLWNFGTWPLGNAGTNSRNRFYFFCHAFVKLDFWFCRHAGKKQFALVRSKGHIPTIQRNISTIVEEFEPEPIFIYIINIVKIGEKNKNARYPSYNN